MKTKKYLALGLLSAMAVTTMTGTNVFAAEEAMEGTGATDISYKAGSSTGGNGDGDVASWTVDYPVKIILDDATVDKDSGRDLDFAVTNTSDGQPYSGGATVKASIKGHTDAEGTNEIKLKKAGTTAVNNVKMKLNDGTSDIAVNTDTQFAELSSQTKTATLTAYLSDKSGAEKDQTYSTTLTWKFNSDKY